MMTPRIGRTQWLQVEATRPRQTAPSGAGFQQALREGGRLLLAGAQVAGGLVGGPFLSAAVSRLRTGGDSVAAAASAPSASSSGGATPAQGSTTDSLRALQQERMGEELQLIALQSEIQRQDRQVSLTSNLLKAKHDTAKQAIGNIRS